MTFNLDGCQNLNVGCSWWHLTPSYKTSYLVWALEMKEGLDRVAHSAMLSGVLWRIHFGDTRVAFYASCNHSHDSLRPDGPPGTPALERSPSPTLSPELLIPRHPQLCRQRRKLRFTCQREPANLAAIFGNASLTSTIFLTYYNLTRFDKAGGQHDSNAAQRHQMLWRILPNCDSILALAGPIILDCEQFQLILPPIYIARYHYLDSSFICYGLSLVGVIPAGNLMKEYGSCHRCQLMKLSSLVVCTPDVSIVMGSAGDVCAFCIQLSRVARARFLNG